MRAADDADPEGAATSKALALRFNVVELGGGAGEPWLTRGFAEGCPVVVRGGNEETAATAGGPLSPEGAPIPRRALRSARVKVDAAITERLCDFEVFGDIAMDNSSEHRHSI